MTPETQTHTQLPPPLSSYFSSLVNRFFKILPLKESSPETLPVYLESLQAELLGGEGAFPCLRDNADFTSLLFILQYLRDYPNCSVGVVKREVFRAIRMCNNISTRLEGGD